jgi:hypothetical protein
MRHKLQTSTLILTLCVMVSISALQSEAQSGSTATQSSSSGSSATQKTSSGERVVVGCVEKMGNSFVLKGDDGTYPLDTDRDLTPYVGKRIKLAGVWTATGTTTTAPMNASSPASAQPGAGEQSTSPQAFVGDLHLHITGEVVGDCATQK